MVEEFESAKFFDQFGSLKKIARQSNLRVADQTPPDPLFSDHHNVFVKSYLVAACSILEAFIQELAHEFVKEMQAKLFRINLPHNFIGWEIDHKFPESGKADRRFESFSGKLKKKDLEERVSGNYYKTKNLFANLGIDFEQDTQLCSFAEDICIHVGKRNKIVHHNDDAADLSFGDVISIIEVFEAYAKSMERFVKNSPFCTPFTPPSPATP